MLGMLFLREDLPAERDRGPHYADIVPLALGAATARSDSSCDDQVPQRHDQALQVSTARRRKLDRPYGGKAMPKLADITKPGYFTASGGYRAGKPDELIRRH